MADDQRLPQGTESDLFNARLEISRTVLGTDYVDGSLERSNEFVRAFQHLATEWCWGHTWSRPGLSRKTRSMLNLAILTVLGKPVELKLHVRGVLTNG